MAAQGALIGVAEAGLYPHFAIGGSIGFAVGNGNGFLNGDSLIGFFTPFSFRWDIFNYGRVKNNVRIQDARFERLLVSYQNKVLLAVKSMGLFRRVTFRVGISREGHELSKRMIYACIFAGAGHEPWTEVRRRQRVLPDNRRHRDPVPIPGLQRRPLPWASKWECRSALT